MCDRYQTRRDNIHKYDINSSPFRRSTSDPALIRLATIYNQIEFDAYCACNSNTPFSYLNCATTNNVSGFVSKYFQVFIEQLKFNHFELENGSNFGIWLNWWALVFDFLAIALFDLRDGMSVKSIGITNWDAKEVALNLLCIMWHVILASNSRESILFHSCLTLIFICSSNEFMTMINMSVFGGICRIIFHYLNSLKSSHCMNLMRNTCLARTFQHELPRKSTQNFPSFFRFLFFHLLYGFMSLTHLR